MFFKCGHTHTHTTKFDHVGLKVHLAPGTPVVVVKNYCKLPVVAGDKLLLSLISPLLLSSFVGSKLSLVLSSTLKPDFFLLSFTIHLIVYSL